MQCATSAQGNQLPHIVEENQRAVPGRRREDLWLRMDDWKPSLFLYHAMCAQCSN